ncbi:MAG: amidohydrolase family protein [Mycobacteriales bacterium]
MEALRAGRVFDGVTSLGPATVVFESGRITAVEQREVPGAVDLGDDVTLLPGLVDTHVHLCFPGIPDVLAQMAVDDEALRLRIRESAQQQLAAGVTTVRDLGDRGFLTAEVPTALTVLASGPPLTTPKGHCWFLGGEVDGLDAMLEAVNERAERGCSVVKVMVSGGNITPGNSPFHPQIRMPELREIVLEAHRLGLQTAAHVHAPVSVVDALDAGVDSLEHASFMTEEGVGADPEVLQRIVDSQVVVSATFGLRPGAVPPPAIATRMEQMERNMLWLASAGARLVIGTDAGIAPGKAHGVLPFAFRNLRAGLSAVDLLRIMTSVAADAIGLAGRKGVIRPGADADLLAVRGDPLADADALHDIVEVWAGGQTVKSSS